jgi:hypothetical protein
VQFAGQGAHGMRVETVSPNYFLDLPRPLDFGRIGSLAVDTLLGPLDADHPLDLEYRSFAESGEGIRWPTLGLRRAAN